MSKHITFESLFDEQKINQKEMLQSGTYGDYSRMNPPFDDVDLMSYHIQQLISEVGEILAADKRWKNFRNAHYDFEEKKEEIADCFIVLMNIAMYSGVSGEEMAEAIKDKIKKVARRIQEN